jgi:hypothetical protein
MSWTHSFYNVKCGLLSFRSKYSLQRNPKGYGNFFPSLDDMFPYTLGAYFLIKKNLQSS